MSDRLIESILEGDFVSANSLFEERMISIQEKKLCETKKMMQTEVVKPVKGKPGQFTGQNTPADWAKYRKAHPSFGMHDVPSKTGKPKKSKAPEHEKTASGGLTKTGIEARKKRGYIQAHPAKVAMDFITAVKKYKETGKLDENDNIPPYVQKAADIAARIPKDDPSITVSPKGEPVSKKSEKGPVVKGIEARLKQKRDQQRVSKLAGQSIKNILRGKNVAKNIGRAARYVPQTTTGKVIGGAVSGVSKELSSLSNI